MDSNGNKEIDYIETFEPLENPMKDYFNEHFQVFCSLTEVKPHGALFTGELKKFHPKHLAFPCKPTDIWVASYAKAGTTWTQELIWTLVRGLEHKNGGKSLMGRFPFFEWDSLMPPQRHIHMKIPENDPEYPGNQWKIILEQEEPRLIKTHMFKQLMPRGVDQLGVKIVYVMRDPRDVCISLYYHSIKLVGYTGDFENFVKLFLLDLYEFGPFWKNILSFWNARHSGNILFIRYEELKEDLSAVIRKVADFLKLPTPESKIEAMVKHLSFDSMKKNPATNNENIRGFTPTDIKFMRKGIVGDYKNHLNDAQIQQFKEWTERWLKDTDFPYYRD